MEVANWMETKEIIAPKSYDVVGDIAIIRLPDHLREQAGKAAQAIMQLNKHIRTVLLQVGPVSGELRLRKLTPILGENKTETTHKESGCTFKVDLEKCYFSPRLSFERMRVASQVKPGEVVVNMFAGVGCFSIVIGKHSKAEKIYSIDINPDAIRYADENVRLNRLQGIVEVLEGDSKAIIEERLREIADRVLMPLPERAYEYLEYGILALKPQKTGIIHYYDFMHAHKHEDPVEKTVTKISSKLENLGVDFNVAYGRVVRAVGPRWYQVVLDIEINKKH